MNLINRATGLFAGVVILIPLSVNAIAQTTVERQSFAAASGELSGPGILAQTTLGEAVTGVAGGEDIVSGSGTNYWTETPELVIEPELLLSEITAPAEPVSVGTEIVASATLLVSPVEHVSLLWSWGDGSEKEGTLDVQDNSITASHTYTNPGVYEITLAATVGDYTESVTFQYVVVFDPNGGFVTGGGWFDSPPGAYLVDSGLVGRATFGFVSRYRRGQAQPEGNTQFQFQAANLSFRSTIYDWLVVAGARAQYKGSGTINGGGDYGFILTALDADRPGGGESDRIRVKIWDKTDDLDVVVYDNGLGTDDNSNSATVLGGGSIMIVEGTGPPRAEIDDSFDEPLTTELLPAFPNPATNEAHIGFSLAEEAELSILVYDIVGRIVARVVEDSMSAGRHQARLDGRSLASGLYVVRMRTSTGYEAVERVVITR